MTIDPIYRDHLERIAATERAIQWCRNVYLRACRKPIERTSAEAYTQTLEMLLREAANG
jgi:hypothetical protein